jgi:hypothetical protein
MRTPAAGRSTPPVSSPGGWCPHWSARSITPDMIEDLTTFLSTPTVDVEYRVETGVTVR